MANTRRKDQTRNPTESAAGWDTAVAAKRLTGRNFPLTFRPHQPRAFTLIEPLVVVAISGILAALLMPAKDRFPTGVNVAMLDRNATVAVSRICCRAWAAEFPRLFIGGEISMNPHTP
jgi:prepilin-type N-terminal cleavage/methylation domain-containing protein